MTDKQPRYKSYKPYDTSLGYRTYGTSPGEDALKAVKDLERALAAADTRDHRHRVDAMAELRQLDREEALDLQTLLVACEEPQEPASWNKRFLWCFMVLFAGGLWWAAWAVVNVLLP